MKRRTVEREPVEITFLKRHDEAVYHPAGTHIFSVGVDDKGSYGIFMATNMGKDVRQLAISETARRVYSLEVNSLGETIYYAADHDSHREVHSLSLEKGDVDTLYTTQDEIVGIRGPSEESAVAVQVGSCEDGSELLVAHFGSTEVDRVALPKNSSAEPVGWLPGPRLAILVRERGCQGDGDLYVSSIVTALDGEGGKRPVIKSRLLVGSVSAAAVRVTAPPPPGPPRATTDPPAA